MSAEDVASNARFLPLSSAPTPTPFPHPPLSLKSNSNKTQSPTELTIRLIHILPRVLPANHVLHLLPLHVLPLVVLRLDEELVRTGAAFEPVLPFGEGYGRGRAGDCENVGAVGADW